MKKLGVIGGLGPMATVYFLQLLTQMSDAKTDQEHMEILVYSKPSIPDRTCYILGESDRNPVPEMIRAGVELKRMGADLIAIPCITAHYFHRELEEKIGLPIMNAIVETTACLEEEGIRRAGILATDGTVQSCLLQDAFSRKGIESICPDEADQRKVMDIIYGEIKAGKEPDMDGFLQISENLFRQGAEVILLACTELSLMKRDNRLPAGCLDVMEALARSTVRICNRVRAGYESLITS